MRPAEFEDEQIIEAAKRLLGAGRRVTGFALRKEIGGGNPSRLVRVWEDYRQSQEVVESEPVQDLPVEVEEALNEMTSSFLDQVRTLAINLNNRAVKTAERRVADVMKSAKEQQQIAEAELIDATAAFDELEGQVQSLQEALEGTRKELQSVNDDRKELGNKLVKLEKDLAVSEQKLSKEQEKASDLKGEVAGLKKANESLESDKADLRKQRDGWATIVESREEEAAKLSHQLSEAQGMLRELEAEKKAIAAQSEERKKERDEARSAQKEAERLVTQLETQLAANETQNKETTEEVQESQKPGNESRSPEKASDPRKKGGKS